MKIRLDKFLSLTGAGTRSEVKKIIRKGSVTVNGEPVRDAGTIIDTQKDPVQYDGRYLTYEEHVYYMLNKPAGYVSATRDSRQKTVLELVPECGRRELFPAGRLDMDTEGLLLITDDGKLAHRLLSPSHHVDKTYLAYVSGFVTKEDIAAFHEGIDIGDEKRTLPAVLQVISAGEPGEKPESEVSVTIHEGRFHQIKRMFEARGKEVQYLKRIRMGPLVLDKNLKTGECRALTGEELSALMHADCDKTDHELYEEQF